MVKIYNSQHQFLKMFDICKNMYITETLSTGVKSLCFKVPCDEENISVLAEENYIETEDYSYIIKEVNSPDNSYIEVYCDANIEDITGFLFSSFDCYRKNLQQAYEYCLSNTEWTVLYKSENSSIATYQLPYVTAYQMLTQIAEDYGQEIWYDTKNKIVEIQDKQDNSPVATYFSNQLKLVQLSKQSSSYEYATVLFPIGKDGLTISSVNNGRPYIENFTYTDKYLQQVWYDDQEEVPEELMRKAEQYLQSVAQPKSSYKVKLSSLGDTPLSIGDSILIIDKIKKIKQKQRVIKIVRYPFQPEKDYIEISNYTADFAMTFIKGQKKIQSDIDYIKKVLASIT